MNRQKLLFTLAYILIGLIIAIALYYLIGGIQ
jgi:hypothetical protein